MLIHREHNKAQHYLHLLDDARCNGRWHEVPELVRKVRKHAPQRKCTLFDTMIPLCSSTPKEPSATANRSDQGLTLTAESESKVATCLRRPTTSSSLADNLSSLTNPLAVASGNENTFPEDAFQARICLGWIYWAIGKPNLAVPELAVSLPAAFRQFGQEGKPATGATHVALLRGAYLHGIALERVGNLTEAAKCYESGSIYIIKSLPIANSSEKQILAETILLRRCMLACRSLSDRSEKGSSSQQPQFLSAPDLLLTPFRNWAVFWETNFFPVQKSPIGIDISQEQVRKVWQAYYDILSMVLQHHMPYPNPSLEFASLQDKQSLKIQRASQPSKLLQSQELKRVQTIYEGLLMKELQFPKANAANDEVHHWADQVMANWRTFAGPSWSDGDLGPGGKRSAGLAVLEILYRAATKSFRSTQILRYLFTVHKSLAEFDLASKALDTYIDIVTKGQARADRSGEPDLGLDNDECAIETAAAGIAMYCTYGKRGEGEKAQKLTMVLERWLSHHTQDGPSSPSQRSSIESGASHHSRFPLSSTALAQGHRALGMSQANWARHTFETLDRPGLHAKAITSFRQAQDLDSVNGQSLETLFGFALILAEIRDIDSAIAVTKRGLSFEPKQRQMSSSRQHGQDHLKSSPELHRSIENGRLLRLWHLLALLLSARQDYTTAAISCEAALDLIGGDPTLRKGSEDRFAEQNMEPEERQNIIEIKMTQLAVIAIMESPEEAVNASRDILALYARFFNPPQAQADKTSPAGIAPGHHSPPESTNGTLKSIRGSLFGRTKANESKSGLHGEDIISNKAALPIISHPTNLIANPTISVTAEDHRPVSHAETHHHHLFRHDSKRLQKRSSKRSIDSNRRSRPGTSNDNAAINGFDEQPKPSIPLLLPQTLKSEGRADSTQVGLAVSSEPPSFSLLPTVSNGITFAPSQKLVAHNIVPPKITSFQGMLSPSLFTRYSRDPVPCFPRVERDRHALSLLTKIWLFIAGLYQRAKMYEDAQGALSEAAQQVRLIEATVASRKSSAQAFAEPGWGGVKAVDELWADVYCEEATLHSLLGSYSDAAEDYEKALQRFPDHPGAIVGLSNILLDQYAQKLSATSQESTSPEASRSASILAAVPSKSPASSLPNDKDGTLSLLSRLAARDRAYGLLSSLTKSGRGWDNSEAWFALAKAYEDGGQVEKAKEALWWVVELEEKRPVRNWDSLGQGYEL